MHHVFDLFTQRATRRHNLRSTDQPSPSQQKVESYCVEKKVKPVQKDFTPMGSYLEDETNQIFLTGPDKNVQLGAAKLDELKINVLEKRVKLPQDLLTFIKSSSAIFKYETLFQQSFRNPVFIELDSDLVLSSLCSHDLDEALAAMVGDLSVEIEKLQGAASVPPDVDRMKQFLTKATNEANRDEIRVSVTFIPGQYSNTVAKIRLVGYTQHVKKLREVLEDYLSNQVSTEQVLNLPHPELVGCFDKILEMTGVKQTKVTLKAFLHPHPYVAVTGPRHHVQESHRSLTSALASLVIDTLVLDGQGALRYFQTDGKVSKELVESSCQVLIQERQVSASRSFANFGYSMLPSSSTSLQSAFLVIGFHENKVDDAMTKMKNLYQDHCSTKTFTKEDLADLTHNDLKDLMKLAETEGLYLQEGQPSQGGLKVSGLKAGVNQVVQKLQTISPLRREMRVKEEENMYRDVTWCLLRQTPGHGSWERLPKTTNYSLEMRNVSKAVVDAQGIYWNVNLEKMEAKRHLTKQTAKLKRLENLPGFPLPLYWDNMGNNEDFKEVVLEPLSAEYLTVQQAFKKTVQKTILKIERLQNVHLRRVYEMQKKHISEKNKLEEGEVEKFLYHGTSQESCDSIKRKGFNRSFSGKNATCYGQGTYFAVNAAYSASHTYSRPAADGTQAMFVARVLTGVYTRGHSNIKVPPPRNDNDRYDSLVDRIDNPGMFVVLHDDQAYPDYLITFC